MTVPNVDELWLASFDDDGRCVEWAYHDLDNGNRVDVPRNLPALDGTGVRPRIAVLSFNDFRTVLQNQDENVSYRVVVVTPGYHGISSHTQRMLGIGLDLGPELFEYAQVCVEDPNIDSHGVLPRFWHKTPPALRVGRNALCILEAGLEEATKTAILFLGSSYLFGGPGPRVSTSSVMYPSKRPSQILEGLCDTTDQPDGDHHQSTWLIQRFITSGIGCDNYFGKDNFLYVCLAALLELQLSTAPLNVPHIGMRGLQSRVILEYCGEYRGGTVGPLAVSADPSIIWARLRKDVDDQRNTLRWITRFFREHFEHKDKNLQEAFDDIMERFTFRVQDLEQSESQLRDHLAAEGTRKSIYMAEMSIRESKRVMLLTALAFVFLPVSLASSIYGMNVQQINDSGHSITAFVITACAMCASSVALWGVSAAFQSYRARLISEEEAEQLAGNTKYPVYKEVIIHGPLGKEQRLWTKIKLRCYAYIRLGLNRIGTLC